MHTPKKRKIAAAAAAKPRSNLFSLFGTMFRGKDTVVASLLIVTTLALAIVGSDAYSLDPQSLTQKSILQMNNNGHRREPIRMPSQTPMVPYRVRVVVQCRGRRRNRHTLFLHFFTHTHDFLFVF